MQREIKFRLWLGHTKKMTYEHSLEDIAHAHWDFTEDIIPLQYTGLQDKNKVDIYEGDILHFVTYSGGGFATFGIDVYKVVEYGKFTVRNESLYKFIGFYAKSGTSKDSIEYTLTHGATVVGNIYSTPSLIKNKTQ